MTVAAFPSRTLRVKGGYPPYPDSSHASFQRRATGIQRDRPGRHPGGSRHGNGAPGRGGAAPGGGRPTARARARPARGRVLRLHRPPARAGRRRARPRGGPYLDRGRRRGGAAAHSGAGRGGGPSEPGVGVEELALLRQAIDLTGVGFVLTDPALPDNPVVYANHSFLTLTGYPRNEVIGRNCRFLQGEDTDRDAVEEL